jgi:alkanesulfonate monooxygenase SsuD/methylene tetrahydromethanopterin reductase-like flavin-dependent oxidoreductase (luciferase family)
MVSFGAFLSLSDTNGQSHRQVYDDALSYAREAERLGCDSVWINEHHFMGFSICPDSLLMAAALLAHTQKIRVGNAISLIPIQHPVSIAERAAMLDNLSGGRFDLGLGRGGYPLDALVFDMPLDKFAAALDQGVDLIHRALSADYVDGTLASGQASLWPFPPVQIYPRPFTKPQPPIFVAGQHDSTMALAAARRLSLLLSWHQSHAEREAVVKRYDVALAAAGHAGPRPVHVGSACVYIADSKQQAVAEFTPRFRDWLRGGRTGAFDKAALAGPYGETLKELLAFADKKAANEDALVAKLMANNPIGSVDDVIAWFREDMARTGTRRYAVFVDVIGEPRRALANLTRLMAEVTPALRV